MRKYRKLADTELQLYADHLKRLGPEDRFLRFGNAVTDEQIQKYVDQQFRIRQTVLASLDSDGNVIAAIELVYDFSRYTVVNREVEIGLSVEEGFRGRGFGSELFKRALLLARNRGAKTVVSQCLSQNRWMMRIAKKHNMVVHSDSGEAIGTLELPPANVASYVDEIVGDGMALWDRSLLRIPEVFNYGAMTFMK